MTLVEHLSVIKMNDDNFFKHSPSHWSNVDATIDGMLGGLEVLHPIDIRDSQAFLLKHLQSSTIDADSNADHSHVLDVGAGIGRITHSLLKNHFHKVSLLESDPRFISQAQKSLEKARSVRVGQLFPCRLQEFRASMVREPFSCIWIQWVLVYASDDDLVTFLRECTQSLKNKDNQSPEQQSLIFIKENVLSTKVGMDVDREDFSVTRSIQALEILFGKAGLKILDSESQRDLPSGLYPIQMWCLCPI